MILSILGDVRGTLSLTGDFINIKGCQGYIIFKQVILSILGDVRGTLSLNS